MKFNLSGAIEMYFVTVASNKTLHNLLSLSC